MFDLMHDASHRGRHLIFDRSHLGEYVYAPIYRDYSGSYVFEIEQEYLYNPFFKDIILFVLIDEPKNAIAREDGNSFSTDISVKQLEIDKFKKAFELSHIENKFLININGKSIKDVHNSILTFLTELNILTTYYD
jgi:thymidylate kinase